MAENTPNTNLDEVLEETTAENDAEKVTETVENEALKSFLEREVATETATDDKDNGDNKAKKLSKPTLWVIIASVAVIVIMAIVITLRLIPEKTEITEFDEGAEINLVVDEKGEHQANLVLNEKGEVENNSYGTLIEYTPSDIAKIEIENESGTFTVLAETPVTTDEESGEETTGATVYTLVGFENIELLTGGPDSIANDVAALSFSSVADPTGENSGDFGFDNPRATVKTTFTDGTTSTIIVGASAPSQLGEYVKFGSSDAVYVVTSDAVDSLLFSVLDLVTLNVNTAAADTTSAEFEALTLSGSAYGSTIELRPNEDKAIDSSYLMISPKKMFISEVEAANITGAIRGLYADEAVCVNPSSAQLSQYGLSSPYAKVTAIYPDTTVNLKASEPKDDSVYLIADSNIIYKISASSVPWIYTTFDKLRPDTVINPNFGSITNIKVTDTSGSYDFKVTTVTDTVETTDGVTEEVESTTAYYKDKRLDEDNFYVFYQNICNMTNAGATDSNGSGTPVLTIELSYSTGRATDVVKVYPTGNTKYIAQLNGETQCLVYKSYCTKFSQCVQDLIAGKTVGSF